MTARVGSLGPFAGMVQRMAEATEVVAVALVGSRVRDLAEAGSD